MRKKSALLSYCKIKSQTRWIRECAIGNLWDEELDVRPRIRGATEKGNVMQGI
jgi:hypothetical protein